MAWLGYCRSVLTSGLTTYRVEIPVLVSLDVTQVRVEFVYVSNGLLLDSRTCIYDVHLGGEGVCLRHSGLNSYREDIHGLTSYDVTRLGFEKIRNRFLPGECTCIYCEQLSGKVELRPG